MKKRTKVFSLVLCFALILATFSCIVVSAEEGYTIDEETHTFNVDSAEGLLAVAGLINMENSSYRAYNICLTNDIDLTTKQWTPITVFETNTSVYYSGTFDGGNHTIIGLANEASTNAECQALIGVSGKGCVVKNVTFTNACLSGKQYVAVAVGKAMGNLTVQNCHVRDSVITGSASSSGNYTAGLVGRFDTNESSAEFLIENCTVDAIVSAYKNAAGICGGEGVGETKTLNVTFRNCVVAGSITGKDTAAGIFCYNGGNKGDTNTASFRLLFDKCICIAKVSAAKVGAMTYRIYNTEHSYTDCIGLTGFVSSDVTVAKAVHTTSVTRCKIISDTEPTAEFFNNNITNTIAAAMKVDGVETADWNTVTLSTIPMSGVKEAATTMYVSDPSFQAKALEIIPDFTTDVRGYQSTVATEGRFAFRLIGVLNLPEDKNIADYQEVGMQITAKYNDGEEKTILRDCNTNVVYQSIIADMGVSAYTAQDFGGDYIFILICKNVPDSGAEITVTPYCTDNSGKSFFGMQRQITVTAEKPTV